MNTVLLFTLYDLVVAYDYIKILSWFSGAKYDAVVTNHATPLEQLYEPRAFPSLRTHGIDLVYIS